MINFAEFTFEEFPITNRLDLAIATVTRKEKIMMDRNAANALAEQAANALARIAGLEAKYGKDEDYKNGDVLTAKIRYGTSDTVYDFAFIKANNSWFSTSTRTGNFKNGTFDELISWLESAVVNKGGEIVKLRKVEKGEVIIKKNKRV